MPPIIEVRRLSKQYALGQSANVYDSVREVLAQGLRRPWARLRGARPDPQAEEARAFWALRDVSFDVERGDTVAIIGSNGAGKSTLLKILSRITDPTEGYGKVRGQLASLLEVGTGFHPELSGRENIFLNGAILGMRKDEIRARFADIVEFSGIGKFLDTPVKRYSSGMYVRLAFAIAAHLDPEILVVDEVLAVGDIAFQKKCLGKMAEACQRDRTVIFVSHNLAAVEALCRRGIVLQNGCVVFDGSAQDAVRHYLEHVSGDGHLQASHVVDLSSHPGRPPRYQPQLRRLELLGRDGQPLTGEFAVGDALQAAITFDLEEPCTSFDASIALDTGSGQRICTAHSAYEPARVHEVRSGRQTFHCTIPSLPLLPGEYRIGVGLDIGGTEVDWVDNAAGLSVVPSDFYGTGVVPTRGVFLLRNRWELAPQEVEVAA